MAKNEFLKKAKAIKETYSELAISFKNTRADNVFSKLYEKMYPSIYNYVYGMLRDYDETSDVIANTMYIVYTKIEQYDPTYQITTWAYKIAYHEAIRVIRDRNKKVLLSANNLEIHDDGYGNDIARCVKNGSAVSTDIFSYVHEKDEKDYLEEEEELMELIQLMTAEINKMKPIYRDIMIDRFNEQMSYIAIVEKHNAPYKKAYDKLEKELFNLKEDYESDLKDADKKKAYYDTWNKIELFRKTNMISEQTVKNRLRRAKIIISEKFKNNSKFEIYNKKLIGNV